MVVLSGEHKGKNWHSVRGGLRCRIALLVKEAAFFMYVQSMNE